MANFNFLMIFDIILLCFGSYMLFAGLRMKKTGKISTLLMNESDANRISDKQGFINYIYVRMMVFAGTIAAYGVLSVLDDLEVIEIPYVQIIGMGVFIVIMVWFFRGLMKARSQFEG